MEYQTTLTTITVTSNQSQPDSALNGLKLTLSYDKVSKEINWTNTPQSVNIPTGIEYTITGENIEGYKTPNPLSQIAEGTSGTATLSYNTTVLSIEVTSNQSDDLDSLTVTVNFDSKDHQLQFNGKETKSINVPTGSEFTITFSEVTGYKTPDAISGTANSASKNETGTYQSEFLTVNVSGASGYTITVSGQGSQTTSPKVYKIPFGTSYNISASNVKGYNTPATQSFTANQVSRSVTMTYTKIANGVYICDSDGKLTAVGSWNTGNNSKAVGVAVVSDKCSFIIDKTNSNNSIQ